MTSEGGTSQSLSSRLRDKAMRPPRPPPPPRPPAPLAAGRFPVPLRPALPSACTALSPVHAHPPVLPCVTWASGTASQPC